MELSQSLEAIDRFFLDLIGSIVPGTALILGGWVILGQPPLLGPISIIPATDVFSWVFLTVTGYVAGHGVISLGHNLLLPIVEFVAALLRKIPLIKKVVPKAIISEAELIESIAASANFRAFVDQASRTYSWLEAEENTKANVHSWRNIALTLSQEHNHTVYRFMFISLLNLGIATVLLFLAAVWLLLSGLSYLNILSLGIPINFWIVSVQVLVTLPFLERRYSFYGIAMRVPFSMAVVKFPQPEVKATPVESYRLLKVYLAGGFKSGWQDKVKATITRLDFLDPRVHGLKDKAHYVPWDLEAIRRSDWVFAYLEATNPAGYALALEVGYAKALGKRIILVDEKSSLDEQTERYLAMVQACADITFDCFEEGLEFLTTLEKAV